MSNRHFWKNPLFPDSKSDHCQLFLISSSFSQLLFSVFGRCGGCLAGWLLPPASNPSQVDRLHAVLLNLNFWIFWLGSPRHLVHLRLHPLGRRPCHSWLARDVCRPKNRRQIRFPTFEEEQRFPFNFLFQGLPKIAIATFLMNGDFLWLLFLFPSCI